MRKLLILLFIVLIAFSIQNTNNEDKDETEVQHYLSKHSKGKNDVYTSFHYLTTLERKLEKRKRRHIAFVKQKKEQILDIKDQLDRVRRSLQKRSTKSKKRKLAILESRLEDAKRKYKRAYTLVKKTDHLISLELSIIQKMKNRIVGGTDGKCICPIRFQPVCGDGVQYASACVANCAGAKEITEGSCQCDADTSVLKSNVATTKSE